MKRLLVCTIPRAIFVDESECAAYEKWLRGAVSRADADLAVLALPDFCNYSIHDSLTGIGSYASLAEPGELKPYDPAPLTKAVAEQLQPTIDRLQALCERLSALPLLDAVQAAEDEAKGDDAP